MKQGLGQGVVRVRSLSSACLNPAAGQFLQHGIVLVFWTSCVGILLAFCPSLDHTEEVCYLWEPNLPPMEGIEADLPSSRPLTSPRA